MSHHFPEAKLDAITEAVGRFPDGARISEIARVLPIPIPARSLLRMLEVLVAQGRLLFEGRGRASRYRLPAGAKRAESTDVLPVVPQLSATPEGEAVRAAVRAPIQERHPVGYRREFLESYRPNETAYLSPEQRQRLAAMGTSPAGELPAGTYARQVFNRLLIDLSWNSSRLEGNTYSLLETERLLALGQAAEGKAASEAQMILNHKAAIELLVEHAAEIGFNRYTICNLHALLSENLLADPQAGGRLRSIAVNIGGTVFHPLSGPQVIEECFDQILATASAIHDPFEQAFFAMVQLPYLQPFEDVNKRVSRFAANIPLIRKNLCPLSFVDVPVRDYIDGVLGVYELNRIDLLRDVFLWAYERSCARYAAVRRSLGEPDPFRLRYRESITRIVSTIIRERMNRETAITFIRREAAQARAEDRARLIEVVETEIMSLHAGNFARYRVRPSEYEAWRASWR
jgi:hypothetical protein